MPPESSQHHSQQIPIQMHTARAHSPDQGQVIASQESAQTSASPGSRSSGHTPDPSPTHTEGAQRQPPKAVSRAPHAPCASRGGRRESTKPSPIGQPQQGSPSPPPAPPTDYEQARHRQKTPNGGEEPYRSPSHQPALGGAPSSSEPSAPQSRPRQEPPEEKKPTGQESPRPRPTPSPQRQPPAGPQSAPHPQPGRGQQPPE